MNPLVCGPSAAGVTVTGLLVFDPALTVAETAYLSLFCESRRWDRGGGPYAVPANPLAECLDPRLDLDAFTRPPAGQPSLHCPWQPTPDGRALIPQPLPCTSDEVVAWLTYLQEHFFAADAGMEGLDVVDGLDEVGEFTGFGPHLLTGAVALADPATGRLEALLVRDGRFERRQLHPGWCPPLRRSA